MLLMLLFSSTERALRRKAQLKNFRGGLELFLMRQILNSWIVFSSLEQLAFEVATSLDAHSLKLVPGSSGSSGSAGRQRQESIRTFPVASSSALLHGCGPSARHGVAAPSRSPRL